MVPPAGFSGQQSHGQGLGQPGHLVALDHGRPQAASSKPGDLKLSPHGLWRAHVVSIAEGGPYDTTTPLQSSHGANQAESENQPDTFSQHPYTMIANQEA